MPEHHGDQSEPVQLKDISQAIEREYRHRRRTLVFYLALLAVPVAVGALAILEGRRERQADLETRAQVQGIEEDYQAVSGQLEQLDTLDELLPELRTSRERMERQEAAVTSLGQGQDGLEQRLSLQESLVGGFEDTRAAFEDYRRRDAEWASGIQGEVAQTRRDIQSFSRSVDRLQAELETSGLQEVRDRLTQQESLAKGLGGSIRDIQKRLDNQERELGTVRLRQDSIRAIGSLIQRLQSLERRFARQDSTLRLLRLQRRDTLPTRR